MREMAASRVWGEIIIVSNGGGISGTGVVKGVVTVAEALQMKVWIIHI